MNNITTVDAIIAKLADGLKDSARSLNVMKNVTKAIPPKRKDGFDEQLGTSDGIIRPFAVRKSITQPLLSKRGESEGLVDCFCPNGTVKVNDEPWDTKDVDSKGYVREILVSDVNNYTLFATIPEDEGEEKKVTIRSYDNICVTGEDIIVKKVKVVGDGGVRPIKNAVVAIASGIDYTPGGNVSVTKFSQYAFANSEKRHIIGYDIPTTVVFKFSEDECGIYDIFRIVSRVSPLTENFIFIIEEHGGIEENYPSKNSHFIVDADGDAGNVTSYEFKKPDIDIYRPKDNLYIPLLLLIGKLASKRLVVITGACYSAGLNEWMDYHKPELECLGFPAISIIRSTESKEYTSLVDPAFGCPFVQGILDEIKSNANKPTFLSYKDAGVKGRGFAEVMIKLVKMFDYTHNFKNVGFPPRSPLFFEPTKLKGILDTEIFK